MFLGEDDTRNEVDLFGVSPTGVYLVEIKSHPGRMDGDAGTWVWTAPEGHRRTFDNLRTVATSIPQSTGPDPQVNQLLCHMPLGALLGVAARFRLPFGSVGGGRDPDPPGR